MTLSLMAAAGTADAIEGRAIVIDGDTITVGDVHVRLEGIDAPELAQRCGRRACGAEAADYLRDLIAGAQVQCESIGRDDYDREIATCRVGARDLGRAMIEAGFAMAFVRYSDTYVDESAEARTASRGLWRAPQTFEPPWEYRARRWNTATQKAPEGCPIKGNISRDGTRIYHTPWGSAHYDRTRIDTSRGERWFCDEREALDAGWRAPLR